MSSDSPPSDDQADRTSGSEPVQSTPEEHPQPDLDSSGSAPSRSPRGIAELPITAETVHRGTIHGAIGAMLTLLAAVFAGMLLEYSELTTKIAAALLLLNGGPILISSGSFFADSLPVWLIRVSPLLTLVTISVPGALAIRARNPSTAIESMLTGGTIAVGYGGVTGLVLLLLLPPVDASLLAFSTSLLVVCVLYPAALGAVGGTIIAANVGWIEAGDGFFDGVPPVWSDQLRYGAGAVLVLLGVVLATRSVELTSQSALRTISRVFSMHIPEQLRIGAQEQSSWISSTWELGLVGTGTEQLLLVPMIVLVLGGAALTARVHSDEEYVPLSQAICTGGSIVGGYLPALVILGLVQDVIVLADVIAIQGDVSTIITIQFRFLLFFGYQLLVIGLVYPLGVGALGGAVAWALLQSKPEHTETPA